MPDPGPLDMARNCVAAIAAIAERQASDDPDVQIQSYIRREGKIGQDTADLAAKLALVSIAESLAAGAALARVEALRLEWAKGDERGRAAAAELARAIDGP